MKNDIKEADTLFSKKIINWYENSGRDDLPWRKNITAYRVWISEIMLQQTQVKTVVPFYRKFIKKYPNLKSLSGATEEDILALWTGLGFYRRAKIFLKQKKYLRRILKTDFQKSLKI
jgi:A/G-specific adenine glycosylase